MTAPAAQLTAADVMSRSLVLARPDQDLLEVEGVLFERRISGLPVVENGALVGVISAGDVARVQVFMDSLDGQVTDNQDWSSQADGFQHKEPPAYHGFREMIAKFKVSDAMNDHVITCAPGASLASVAGQMLAEHVHRVIVVEQGKPVGIVSSLDLVKVLAKVLSNSAEK
jgi:CBS domain-containing protein